MLSPSGSHLTSGRAFNRAVSCGSFEKEQGDGGGVSGPKK